MICRRTVLWPTSIATFTPGGFSSNGCINSSIKYGPVPSEPRIAVVMPCEMDDVAPTSFSRAATERFSRSMNPGATIMPFTSRSVSPAAGLNRPISAIFPSRMRTLPVKRLFPLPSRMMPFTRTRSSANAEQTRSNIKRNNRRRRMLHSAAL